MIRLAIRVRREDAELVLAELIALAPAGVEELEVGEGEIEYAVYGAPGELPELPDLRAAAGEALCEISTSEVPDDWSERWRRFHRPVLIEPPRGSGVPALYVRPPWEAPSERAGVREIAIDPGQAFGTGAHATTRLCLEFLLELAALEPERGALLDVGTGSGVLAIAAAHLGFEPVLALDNEVESVKATKENAEVNGVEIEVRRYDLRSEALPWVGSAGRAPEESRARVLTANLLCPLLLDLARSLGKDATPRHLIAGGLLIEEVDEVARAFTEHTGLHERERRERGEWAALWLSTR